MKDMSVHRPVRNLLRRIILNPQVKNSIPQEKESTGPAPDSEFVTLCETLAAKLMKDPSLLGFFTDEIHFEVCNMFSIEEKEKRTREKRKRKRKRRERDKDKEREKETN